jgi:hypothetical protein
MPYNTCIWTLFSIKWNYRRSPDKLPNYKTCAPLRYGESTDNLIRDLDLALRARTFKRLVGPLAHQVIKRIAKQLEFGKTGLEHGQYAEIRIPFREARKNIRLNH